ncbi:MAG: hypothetical protein ABW046_07920 [Actinoplanes sp.]
MTGGDGDLGSNPNGNAARELRRALDELHARQGRPSRRRIANLLNGRLSHTAVGDVLRGKRTTLPTMLLVVDVLHGDHDRAVFERLWRAANDSPHPADEPAADPGPAGVRIFSGQWMDYLLNGNVSDDLFRGAAAAAVSPVLAPLEQFILDKPDGIAVDVHTRIGNRVFPARSVPRLWAIMLVDSVLSHDPIASRRWLLSETDKILARTADERAGRGESREQADEVWNWLFTTYLRPGGPGHADAPDLLSLLLADARVVAGNDANKHFRIFNFLRQVCETDPECTRLILATLRRHEDSLPASTPPASRIKVQTLIWRTSEAAGRGQPMTAKFQPDLIDIPAARPGPGDRPPALDYPFQAMRHPLTVGDVDAILQRQPEPAVNPRTPKVFTGRRPGMSDHRVFAELTKQLTDIVTRCQMDSEDDWQWAVPTGAEWLVLAGCVDHPYPWGDHPPTRDLANLHFSGEPAKLMPVGIYGRSGSPYGADDCCGGVHELVLTGRNEHMPSDFRLAGASYRSPPQNSSCQKLRTLSTGEGDVSRRNLGLRLIRYHRRDSDARWKNLGS